MIAFILTCTGLLIQAADTQPSTRPAEPVTRFAVVDVFVDVGERKLAAYQFELKATVGKITITGLERGEHTAFAKEPYYDPAALHREGRIVVAAFSTDKELPTGKTRVAQLHVMITGEVDPQYEVTLTTAASADGKPIPAKASATQGANR